MAQSSGSEDVLGFVASSTGELPWWLIWESCLLAMLETRVLSLGLEDPLEKEMAILSSTLACRIPWMEEPHRLQSMGLQKVGHD